MSKFPSSLVAVIPRLAEYLAATPLGHAVQTGSTPRRTDLADSVGWEYVSVPEDINLSSSDPYSADPAVVERGLVSHRRTQNALAAWARTQGYSPLRPGPGDPLFDLAWRNGSRLFVCEVKSMTMDNEERQLRLGLGQVLRYRHWLERAGRGTVAVLVPEREPTDPSWRDLCAELNVNLTWPPAFAGL
jgi:hypothetical protein